MKRFFVIVIALVAVLSGFADERGMEMLQRISRRYNSLGSYRLSFTITMGDGSMGDGVLSVAGNNLYMKMADNEIFVEDSVRYEVRARQREIVVDRADAYDNEAFNPLKGVDKLNQSYDVAYDEASRLLRLTPKSGNGDAVSIYVAVDGESVERVVVGSGDGSISIGVGQARYTQQSMPRFDKTSYAGFEVIDFR